MEKSDSESSAGTAIVLGGGIAGLAAASALTAAGWRVTVIEATEKCGGFHRDRKIGRMTFDFASIFYEDDASIFELMPGVREDCPVVERVMRRIDTDGVVRPYPLKLVEALSWPFGEKLHAAVSLAYGQIFSKRDGSLEAICRKRLGNKIYSKTNLRGYIERFNRASPEQIDEAFFHYRMSLIAKATRPKGIWRAFRHRGRRWTPKAKLRIRPATGYSAIFGQIVSDLGARGVQFFLSQELTLIERSNDVLHITAGGQVFSAELVVGAMPLDLLYQAAFGSPSGLQSIGILTLFVSAEWLAADTGNVLYNFDRRGIWKRATIYSRLYPEIDAGEFFSVEVTFDDDNVLDPDQAFRDLRDHLTDRDLALGLKLEGHEISFHAYPSYSIGYGEVVDNARQRLAEAGVALVGRQGAFEYFPTSTGVIGHVRDELRRRGLASQDDMQDQS